VKRSRMALLWVSAVVAAVLVGSGLVARVGAADGGYRQAVLFSEVLSLVTDNYVDPVDTTKLLGGAFEGMLGGLDARGAYLTPAEVEAWRRGSDGANVGPGLAVLKAFGSLQVVAVDAGSPAAEAGIQPGDQIRRIAGNSLHDLSLDQASRLLLGPAGSKVACDVLHSREGFRAETIDLERRASGGPASELRREESTAVLVLRDVRRVDADRLSKELEKLGADGAQRLLVDARNLAEPDVRQAEKIAGLLVDGPLFRLVDRKGVEIERLAAAPGAKRAWTGDVALLVNGATAGAGEGLARLLQARGLAKVYGEDTYGLGTEVELIPLPDGSALLLPTRMWTVASGEGWIDGGVKPDLAVEGSGRTLEEREADQLRRAIEAFATVPKAAPEAA